MKLNTKYLGQIIIDNLRPLIEGRRCILIDVPHYPNIGDFLIWQGTISMLKKIHVKKLFSASKESFTFPNLSNDVIILLQGGGNFGDLWVEHQIFRTNVIKHYPNNKIIILPQTVFFRNEDSMIKDASIWAKHKDLTIIARDSKSLDTLKHYFYENNIMMLPDMAFCIPSIKSSPQRQTKQLFIKRRDIEADIDLQYNKYIPQEAKIHDWPTLEPGYIVPIFWRIIISIAYRIGINGDWYWNCILRPYYFQTGVKFINEYKDVFTTRLHGAILSLIMGKNVTMIDNNYGKNSSFYETWLDGYDNIQLVRHE